MLTAIDAMRLLLPFLKDELKLGPVERSSPWLKEAGY